MIQNLHKQKVNLLLFGNRCDDNNGWNVEAVCWRNDVLTAENILGVNTNVAVPFNAEETLGVTRNAVLTDVEIDFGDRWVVALRTKLGRDVIAAENNGETDCCGRLVDTGNILGEDPIAAEIFVEADSIDDIIGDTVAVPTAGKTVVATDIWGVDLLTANILVETGCGNVAFKAEDKLGAVLIAVETGIESEGWVDIAVTGKDWWSVDLVAVERDVESVCKEGLALCAEDKLGVDPTAAEIIVETGCSVDSLLV